MARRGIPEQDKCRNCDKELGNHVSQLWSSGTLRNDNGPPFASRKFEDFLEYLAIDHKKGKPYWPQSDDEVERLNETLLKTIRIAELQGKD